jgi:HEAT repeat protein
MTNKNTYIIKKVIFIILVVIFAGLTACTNGKPVPKKEIPKEEPVKPKIPADTPKDVKILIERLSSPDVMVRQKSARRLGKMGEEASASIPFLIEMLNDNTLIIKYITKDGVKSTISRFPSEYAAEALGKIGSPAVEPLIAALSDDRLSVRTYSIKALGIIKDTRALEPLINALDDKEELVQRSAMQTLGEITKEDIGEDRAKWQGWWKENKGKFSDK